MLFRVDGGKVWGISMGHIKRSLILSTALAKNKYRVIYIMKNYPDGVAYVRQYGFYVDTIDVEDNSDDCLIALCKKYSPKHVIIDIFHLYYNVFFQYARENSIQTIVFDTLGNCVGQPDILFNDSLVSKFTDYSHLNGKTKTFIGPKFFMIEDTPEIVQISNDKVQNIMITMGGSDPAGLTIKILRSMIERLLEFNVNVVLGPSFNEEKDVYALLETRHSVVIYKNPENFLNLLSRQDIVISSAGRTLYECAYFGRPSIIVPSIEHERETAKEYAKHVDVFDVGLWDEMLSPDKIFRAITQYKNNYYLRKNAFTLGRTLVDGSGLKRIIRIINNN